jgi:two-component system, NarL family, nitrate/nitrite response regulator NarL
MTRVFVVSNIRLYCEGLSEMLVRDGRLEVVGAAAEAPRDADRIRAAAADVVLLDMGIPDALDAIRRLSRGTAPAKVVALGVANRSQRVVACAEAGVANYVGRDSSLDELVQAVEGAVRGEFDCSPRIAAALVGRVATLAAGRGEGNDDDLYLTPRQLEVARLLDRGLTNQEIGTRLNIEVSTVKIHVHNIMDKLGVHRRGQAVAKLHRSGLLPRGGDSHGLNAVG